MKRGKLQRVGTCQRCKLEQELNAAGRIFEHDKPLTGTGDRRRYRCTGSGLRSDEDCEPDRQKARAERRAAAERVRHEALVMLDALQLDHATVDEDKIVAYRKHAFALYRILYLRSQPDRSGIKWRGREDRQVDLFCVFCGDLVATFPKPWWQGASEPKNWNPVQKHVSICALQFLGGLRVPPPPGTCNAPTGQMTLAEVAPVGDGPLFGGTP